MKKRTLVVGLERKVFSKIDPLLSRSHFAVDRVSEGASGALLCSHVAFELVIVGYPLADMSMEEFIGAIRAPGAPSAGSQLLVLAEEERLEEINGPVRESGAVALSSSQPGRVLEEAASRLLDESPRWSIRLAVRLQVQVGEARALVMCQTENLSLEGMLIRTDRQDPIGTKVAWELTLPGDQMLIQGEGQIVRHATADVEKIRGVVMLFLDLKGETRKRWEAFLDGIGAWS